MKFLSFPTHRRHVPRQGLLLAVSLITFWIPLNDAQLTVDSVPANAIEGEDVLLLVQNLPENPLGYNWYKGENVEPDLEIIKYLIATQTVTNGPMHSGREILYTNGSLLFRNVSMNDTGYYTIQVTSPDLSQKRESAQLHVYVKLPKPRINSSTNSSLVEHKDAVVLTCELEIQDITYQWFINSHSIPVSNRTLTLHNVTRNDTGSYECEVQNPVSVSRSDPFNLTVLYGPDPPTISPSESYYSEGAALNLSCQAASNPPAQYSWLIDGRPLQATEELFIPSLSVDDSGSYTCHVHNPDTGLTRTTVKKITVLEPMAMPYIQASNTTVTELDLVVLTCLTSDTEVSIRWFFNGQSLQLTDKMILTSNNSTLIIYPVRKEDAGYYQCEVSNPVTSRKSSFITLSVSSGGNSTGLSAGAIAGIVFGVLAGMALIAALGYLLFRRRTGRSSGQLGPGKPCPPVSSSGCGPSSNSASLETHAGPKSAVPIYEELQYPDTNTYCRITPKAETAS